VFGPRDVVVSRDDETAVGNSVSARLQRRQQNTT